MIFRTGLILAAILSISLAGLAKKHNGDFGLPKNPPKHVVPKKPIKPGPIAVVPKKPAPQQPIIRPTQPIQNRPGLLTPDDFAREWIGASSTEQRPPIPDVQDDLHLVQAVQDRRDLMFVQAANVTVLQIMPDDNEGLRHQRWYVKLSSGESVFAVYNVDITARVPVEVNQKMKIGGEFKWTNQGALIHWLHEDPKEKRPDGYVEVGGQRYGKVQ